MTDIVDRLRWKERPNGSDRWGHETGFKLVAQQLLDEAANEIERLRNLVNEILEDGGGSCLDHSYYRTRLEGNEK